MGNYAIRRERTFIKPCDSSRKLDILARKARKVESAPAAVIQAVVEAVSPIFE
jgi:hypothetical protein